MGGGASASAFRHSATQSDTGAFLYWTGFPYSGTGLVPAVTFFFTHGSSARGMTMAKKKIFENRLHMTLPGLERRKMFMIVS